MERVGRDTASPSALRSQPAESVVPERDLGGRARELHECCRVSRCLARAQTPGVATTGRIGVSVRPDGGSIAAGLAQLAAPRFVHGPGPIALPVSRWSESCPD